MSGALTAGSVAILEGNDGTYGTVGSPLTSQINVPSGVTLEGDPAQARPVIHSSVSGNPGIETLSTTSAVVDVDIEYTGNEAAIDGPGAFNRVIANVPSGTAQAATFLNGATLTDSICSGKFGIYDSLGGGGADDFTLRNDTIYGSTTALTLEASGTSVSATISNTIIRSASGPDVVVEGSSGSATATLDHSNYGSVSVAGSATATAAGSATNQTATPSFVDLTTHDFHEAAASPTIDAGADGSANGTLDLDGNPRDVGLHTDIGAYEFLIAPSTSTTAATAVTGTSAALNGAVDPEALAATYQFQYGTSTSYGSVTPSTSAGAANGAAAVTAPLSGLSPGTTYHYRVVATNSQGSSYSADATFTTLTASLSDLTLIPAKFAAAKSGPTASTAKAHKHETHSGTTISYTLNEAASVTFTVTESEPGRSRHAGTCVKQTHANRHAKRCTRTITNGSFAQSGNAGTNSFHFSGRLSGHALSKGRYTLTATPTADALAGTRQTATFQTT
jgi:hypothetical protein